MIPQSSRKRQRQCLEEHASTAAALLSLLAVASVASSQHTVVSAATNGPFSLRTTTFASRSRSKSLFSKIGRGGSSPDGYNYNGYNYDDYNSQQPPQDSAYYQQGGDQDEQQDGDYYNSNENANNPNFGDAGDSWSSYQEQQPRYNAPPPPPNRQDQGSSQQPGYFGGPPPPPPQQYQDQQQQQQGPPPPVSSVTPAETTRTPIHYKFPSTAGRDKTEEGDDAERGEGDGEDNDDKRKTPDFASPRDDAVTRYMMTKRGKMQLLMSSALVGGSLGAFGGKSLFHIQNVLPWFTFCLFLSFFTAWLLRNPYGELMRAMGLAFILVLKRTRAIRKDYPTWPYVPSFFHLKPRMTPPFPPSSNPWRYTPRRPSDVDFQMFPSVVAMGLVGSAVGGSIPLLPTWMGSLAGAATFALSTTLPNARGDLCRIMGMRVVATTLELWDIQADLEIIPKMGVVGGKIMDKILILDRKHRIKDRLVTVLSWGYDQAMKQADAARGGRDSGDGDRRRRPGDDDRRRRDRDDKDGDRRRDRPPLRDGRDEGRRGRFDDNDDRDRRRPRDEQDGRGGPRRREGGGSDRDRMGGPSSRDDDRGGRMRRDGRDGGGDDGDRYRSRPRYDDDDDRRRGDNRRGDDRRDDRRDDQSREENDNDNKKDKKGRMFWN